MFIATDTIGNAIPNYFDFYFRTLKVGLTIGIESASFLKSGMGKSYTANKLGEVLDKDFSVSKIVLEPKEFVDAMDELERLRKSSQVITIDEAGILVNLRKWQSFVNSAISDVVMTFRNLNSLCIFVSPDILLLDKQVRIFISHLIRTKKSVDTSNKVSVLGKIYRLNWVKQGYYYRTYHLQMFSRDIGRKIKIGSFDVSLPSKKLCQDYEDKIEPYKSKLRHAIVKIKKDTKNSDFFVDRFFLDLKEDPRSKLAIGTKRILHYTDKSNKPYVLSNEIQEYYELPVRKASLISNKINSILVKEWIKESMKKKIKD
jgi:hypothetical protein